MYPKRGGGCFIKTFHIIGLTEKLNLRMIFPVFIFDFFWPQLHTKIKRMSAGSM